MEKIKLPDGWSLRPAHYASLMDYRKNGTRRGWYISDPDGNEWYCSNISKAETLAARIQNERI